MTAKRKRYRLTQACARRVLEFRGHNGSTRRVVVRLGLPRRASRSVNEDWVCPYDIAGLDRAIRRAAHGIDAFQALSLGLHIIQVELEVLAKQAGGGEYYFLGAPDGLRIVEGCQLLVPNLRASGESVRKPALPIRQTGKRRRR